MTDNIKRLEDRKAEQEKLMEVAREMGDYIQFKHHENEIKNLVQMINVSKGWGV